MTAKDYRTLAAALAHSRPTLDDYTTVSAVGNNTMANHISFNAAADAWTVTRSRIADALATDNPRFDRARFRAATEVDR
jgi:hypothetical protein